MKKKRILFFIGIPAGLAVLAGAVAALLLWNGVVHFNNVDREKYPIVGVDVSSYQGEIDWPRLAENDIRFAFIKATEGSSFVDPCFEHNWREAQKTDLRIGAYHFFSFESPGAKQAELFCKTVSRAENMLPPVVDVEYYGKFRSADDIDAEQIRIELRNFIDVIEREYSVKPILYATQKSLEEIIGDGFSDCPLWFRSVWGKVPQSVAWTFWQYSNRHVLPGFRGKEKYIDMNVFNGSPEEFASFPGQ